jgi:hypothetical protein
MRISKFLFEGNTTRTRLSEKTGGRGNPEKCYNDKSIADRRREQNNPKGRKGTADPALEMVDSLGVDFYLVENEWIQACEE